MRTLIDQLPASKIREVANAAMGRSDVLAFWFGESDEPTPQFIRDAAARSIADGETFYSHNLGLAELREAIAGYVATMHPAVGSDRIAVTSSGVNALMLAMQALVGAGDEVVAVVPVWPNLTAQPAILGAHVTRFSLRPSADGDWRLDVEALQRAVTDRTRVLLVNSPNNPTGWTLTRAEQELLLAHCRSTGTWIVADEVYERVFFGAAGTGVVPASGEAEAGSAAPSFLDIAGADDRLIVVHSFSKSFLMTGWRLGWPPARRHGACARQAYRVQHLVRAGVRPARRPGGAGTGSGIRSRPGRAPEGVPRHLAAAPPRLARRQGRDAARRPLRLLPRPRQRRLAGVREAAGRRRRRRPCPRRRLRLGGRGLAALVLRLP
jgi:aspartate/methionine/tyrosine aminotransferase